MPEDRRRVRTWSMVPESLTLKTLTPSPLYTVFPDEPLLKALEISVEPESLVAENL
jgi:hypothetical protein